jgi:predicted PurR-regulated permease PerM
MRDTKLVVIFLAVLTFFAVGFMLHLLSSILLPLVIAFFLSMIFSPLVGALRRRKVPGAISILLVLVLVSATLFVFSWIFYSSSQSFMEALPRYQARLASVQSGLTQRLSATFPAIEQQIRNTQWDQAVDVSALTGHLASWVGSLFLVVNELFLVILYRVFLLMESEDFPAKLNRAFAAEGALRLGGVMHNIEQQVRKYLVMKTFVNLINATAVTLLLAACGVDFPLVWGFLTFLAHFIPQVGAILSVGLPTIFMLIQFESIGWAVLVSVLNLAIQFTVGNVVEPRMMGTSLDMSPLLVLLSLIFWGWLWGAWGMVLAVPITSTIKIVCENIEALRPIAVLMSE